MAAPAVSAGWALQWQGQGGAWRTYGEGAHMRRRGEPEDAAGLWAAA